MLSVVIPTDDAEAPVVATLAALVPGSTAGLVSEVMLADRTRSPAIERVADIAGCNYLPLDGSRASAMVQGAQKARGSWLLFLHPGAVLDHGWIDETSQFMNGISRQDQLKAAVFSYARSSYGHNGLRDTLASAARLMMGPYPDQGLLIARAHYDRLGGYSVHVRHPERTLLARLGRADRTRLRTRIFVPGNAEKLMS